MYLNPPPTLTLNDMVLWCGVDEIVTAFSVPENIDKEILWNNLLTRCRYCSLYDTGKAEFLMHVTSWFSAMYGNFQKLAEIANYEYNPIHNYDRTEERSYSSENSENNERMYTGNNTTEGTDTSHTEGKDGSTDETTRSAYNQDVYSPYERRVQSGNNSADGTNTQTATNTSTSNEKNTATATKKDTENSHISGNIGVTTTQQMLESEIELWKNYNIYNTISELWEIEFCYDTF